MNAGLIVLSGGKSSRMGRNKALLPIEGKAMIQRIFDSLGEEFSDRILVTNRPEEYAPVLPEGVKIVSDVYPGSGPLSGIHAGLLASAAEYNVVAACDMPFVSRKVAQLLVQNSNGYEAVVPRFNGMRQPLFAVYHKSAVREIEGILEGNDFRVNNLWEKLNTLWLEEDALSTIPEIEQAFININYPEEYDALDGSSKSSEG
ncbi:molybdenum cofactor guanylyltransferase [Evansella sp. LMS18]|jgi:molybdopterin-guanine dinucleotide biosynthesis protein A|uniref:molybdenum cofactor guanylyltransferase n=1 Tax=Evansella sp. LMS18 TaxID=2924033 RepID=UPI0020D0EEB1|nr:molybdenum cofactor guanylyltransferase [Evansella sp. LMS18]UTR10291.1 molybdenum cofactor guanylyltransferase [Evansella sp. LMS18]